MNLTSVKSAERAIEMFQIETTRGRAMTRDEAIKRAEAIRDEIFRAYSYGGALEEGGSFRLPKHGDWVGRIARAILDAAHPDQSPAPPSLRSLAQQVVENARALEQAIVNQEIYRALTTELQADVTRCGPGSPVDAKTPLSTEASLAPLCERPQRSLDPENKYPKPLKKRGDWILKVHQVYELCSQRGLPMPGLLGPPDFQDPLLIPEQWVDEYEKMLKG